MARFGKFLAAWAVILTQPGQLCCLAVCGPPRPQAPTGPDCCGKKKSSATIRCRCCCTENSPDCKTCCDVAFARANPPRPDGQSLRHWLSHPALAADAPHDLALLLRCLECSGTVEELMPSIHNRRQAGLCLWLK